MNKKSQRVAQQSRGHLRTELILDGCARLLIKDGPANLTTHGIALEAETSIGSLYHFFPDKTAILQALASRHMQSLETIVCKAQEVQESQWVSFTVEEVIEILAMPLLKYIHAHPDYLLMAHPAFEKLEPYTTAMNMVIEDAFNHVLKLRLPKATAYDQRRYTLTLVGLPVGILHKAYENQSFAQDLLLIEVPRALVAYLSAIEKGHIESSQATH
ncbi:TetR/AcrR family transcriptional regulator [Halopseudomonas pelagia]|uniref:TetR family transcriptional regulator n=1 Tax=Halopseudomonas pelagia TaxID=553151 RepID=A0AA91U3C7_9GAMM|nr:TetR/AcrR family transcriptional regulator [Halopseudomonas pelagia]PCC99595.1 TetR family transcriptional regulator [Halopseudomonas pelagia]QFY56466.1 TetR/AcrR family transcriptional regulator [Halopseudomonas pelagia]